MPIAPANGIELFYVDEGGPDGDPLLLVTGLAAQLTAWPQPLVEDLVGRGFRAIRLDNRDAGLSTQMEGRRGDIFEVLADPSTAPYLLADMAADCVALLDHLGIQQVHVVGLSMGGMIAQEVAIRHPQRLISLTSIMSTPSANVGEPTPEAQAALLAPTPRSEEEAAELAVSTYRVVGSPGYPLDEEWLRALGAESFRRANDPAGVVRQLAAIIVSPDRRPALAEVTTPTLVIHGDSDPLIQPAGGEATAQAIRGARLVTYPGMGHDLPEALWPEIVAEIVDHALRATKETQ